MTTTLRLAFLPVFCEFSGRFDAIFPLFGFARKEGHAIPDFEFGANANHEDVAPQAGVIDEVIPKGDPSLPVFQRGWTLL